MIRALAIVAMLLPSGIHEHKVGSDVAFAVNRDHSLQPMLPVNLIVEQESGPRPEGPMSCDVIAREHQITKEDGPATGTETVLKCGPRVFVLKKIMFTGSK